jgi:predicted tellurium resistance membrane protein TerC
MALVYWIGFSMLILLNVAVINRDPPIIMGVTFVILSVAVLWEAIHRRRKARQAARQAPGPSVARPQAAD